MTRLNPLTKTDNKFCSLSLIWPTHFTSSSCSLSVQGRCRFFILPPLKWQVVCEARKEDRRIGGLPWIILSYRVSSVKFNCCSVSLLSVLPGSWSPWRTMMGVLWLSGNYQPPSQPPPHLLLLHKSSHLIYFKQGRNTPGSLFLNSIQGMEKS